MDSRERLVEYIQSDPEAAAKLLKSLRSKMVQPHPGQVPVIESKARFKVVNAGRRWGKTKIAVKLMVDAARAPDGPRDPAADRLVWWVAPTYKVVKRGYREAKRQIPRELLTHDFPPETNFDGGRSVILHFKTGASIEFYSAERPGGMLGEGVNFAVMDEAATIPSTVWEQIVRPTLADKLGGAILISTPRGRNWFYNRWLAGQDPKNESWASWTFPSVTNPYLPEEEIEEMRDELPMRLYQQEVEAEFLVAGSSVFMYDNGVIQPHELLDNNMVEGIAPEGHVFLGIDLAKTNDYTVLYGARDKDRRNCYYERLNSVSWKEQKRRIARAVRKLRRAGAAGVTLVMDSTGLGDPIVEDMQDLGYDVIPVNFTSTKAKMVVRLANDLERGKAFLLNNEELAEFENYAMDSTPKGVITYGAPAGQHDDAVSAKMLSHWGMVEQGTPEMTNLAADSELPQSSDDDEEFADLIDEEEFVAPNISVVRAPSPAELMARPEVWHRVS